MTSAIQQASQAPPPPIPPVPPTAGAATGGATVTQVQIGGDGTADAQRAIQNAIEAAQNAAGQAGTLQPPRVVQVSPDIPPEVVPIVGIVFGAVALMVIVTPIVRGIMRMIERRQEKTLVHGPAVAQQLAQLQQSVDALAIEVERISESQRFQAKVLAERERPALGGGEAAAR